MVKNKDGIVEIQHQLVESDVRGSKFTLRYRTQPILLQSSKQPEQHAQEDEEEVVEDASKSKQIEQYSEQVLRIDPIVEERVMKSEAITTIFGNKYGVECKRTSSGYLAISGDARKVQQFIEYFDRLVAKNVPFTHFIAIPILADCNAQFLESFDLFQQECADSLPFIAKDKLHITLLMLRLTNSIAIKKAEKLMVELQPKLQDIINGSAVARAVGVDVMKGSLRKANVLHAVVECSDQRLDAATKLLIDTFVSAGLAHRFEAEMPKYHITLINSKYYPSSIGYQPFDATDIFAKYNSHEFGEILAEKFILISRS